MKRKRAELNTDRRSRSSIIFGYFRASMSKEQSIGVLGGMGPLATALLFERIVSLTEAAKDQDHVRTFVDSNPSIPDRNAAILGSGEDPRPKLVETAQNLERMGATLLVMPCNTAHHFHSDVQEAISIPLLHMVEETVRYIVANHSEVEKVGVLATDGTLAAGVYQKAIEAAGLEAVQPSGVHQQAITELIDDGIKAGKRISIDPFLACVAALRADEGGGAQLFILGCTELSVAQKRYDLGEEVVFVDPMTVVASVAIRAVGKRVVGDPPPQPVSANDNGDGDGDDDDAATAAVGGGGGGGVGQ